MSKISITKRSTILLFVFVVSVALIAADLVVVAAQDDQTRGGQMTSNGNMQNSNTGTGGGSRRRRRRRGGNTGGQMNDNMGGNTSSVGGDTGNANMSGDTSMQGNANMSGADTSGGMNMNTGGGRRRRRRRGGGGGTTTEPTAVMTTTTPVPDKEEDLSGTYTGTFNCVAAGASGEGTMTITGNGLQWSGTIGDKAPERIVARTTRGYTAVAVQFGKSVAPDPGQPSVPPTIISLRGRKVGDNWVLTPVPNDKPDCAFTPAGGGGGYRGRRRGRRARRGSAGMTMNVTQ